MTTSARWPRPAGRLGALVVLVALAGCAGAASGGVGGRHGAAAGAGGPEPGGTITVLAASSLAGVFSDLGERFEKAHQGTKVTFAFAASPALAAQVRAGAPADLVATADRRHLDDLARDRLVTNPQPFARNHLAILVERGNPRRVGSLADLARPGLIVVVCATEVPCGALAQRSMARARALIRPRSFEPDVKAVVSRVVLGEADAGLVYASDVPSAGPRVEGVPLEVAPHDRLSTSYALAPVASSRNASLARSFVAFVLSRGGQELLRAAGFDSP